MAITRVSVGNPRANTSYSNPNFGVELVRIAPDSSGNCYDGSITGLAAVEQLPIGAQLQDSYGDNPLVYRPTGTAKYCIGLSI